MRPKLPTMLVRQALTDFIKGIYSRLMKAWKATYWNNNQPGSDGGGKENGSPLKDCPKCESLRIRQRSYIFSERIYSFLPNLFFHSSFYPSFHSSFYQSFDLFFHPSIHSIRLHHMLTLNINHPTHHAYSLASYIISELRFSVQGLPVSHCSREK